MRNKITMWVFAILWTVGYSFSNNEINLLISQLWLIASWFIKDE